MLCNVVVRRIHIYIFQMADPENPDPVLDGADSDEENDGYQVAEKRDLDELVNLDQDDDALQR